MRWDESSFKGKGRKIFMQINTVTFQEHLQILNCSFQAAIQEVL